MVSISYHGRAIRHPTAPLPDNVVIVRYGIAFGPVREAHDKKLRMKLHHVAAFAASGLAIDHPIDEVEAGASLYGTLAQVGKSQRFRFSR